MRDIDIKKCLDGQVAAGKLSRELAEEAYRNITRLQRQYADEMAPDQALAAAQAETARIMEEAAKRRRFQTQRQIIAADRAMREMESHPDGLAAGGMALLVKDMRGKATYANVETRTEAVLGQLFRRAEAGLSEFRSKAAGLVQNKAGMRNVVAELFGRQTGDQAAAEFARGFADAAEYGAKRYIRAGGDLVEREDWRLPQVSDGARMRRLGRDAWIEHMTEAQRRGDVRIIDFETGEALAPGATKLQPILSQAFENLTREAGPFGGGAVGRHNERRVFHWQAPDAWLSYNDRFGVGSDLYGLLVGHMQSMARDIAMTEVLGPKHGATVRAIAERIHGADDAQGLARFNPVRTVEGAAAFLRTYDVVSGKLGRAQSELTAALFGGIRSWLTATRLGSAVISAVPSDAVVAAWAAKANGMSAVKLMGTALKQMNPLDEGDRRLALRMGIVSHAVMDSALMSKRFGDEIVGQGIPGRIASVVIRAQGLSAWTNGMKNAFMLEMMGHVADNAGRPLNEVSKPLRRTLKRYGFTAAEWDAIRSAPLLEHDGARFFDPSNVPDERLGEKLMEMMITERQYAVLEPDARTRQLTTGGFQRGTFAGEIARSVTLFKSFTVTMMTTLMGRQFRDGVNGGNLLKFATLSGFLTLAGAVSIQARQIITGKDPRNVNDRNFWISAFMQGGAAGIFGDFLYSGFSRDNQSMLATMAGPVVGGITEDIARIGFDNVREAAEGEQTRLGSEVARLIRGYTPGSNLWYARLVADRALWDNVQSLVDPDYRRSFARMEQRARKDYGQRFWWGPGDAGPDRAPDLGAALR